MPGCATRGMTTPCKRAQTGSRKTANQKAKDGITKSEMYSNKTAKACLLQTDGHKPALKTHENRQQKAQSGLTRILIRQQKRAYAIYHYERTTHHLLTF